MRRAAAILLITSLAVLVRPGAGQDVNPSDYAAIRVDVDTVRVRVSVSDSLNRFVTGLQPEHFRLFED